MDELDTVLLEEVLQKADSLTEFLSTHETCIYEERQFADCMKQMMRARKLKKSDVIRLSLVDRVYAYEVLKGSKRPSRDKVLMFAVGLDLALNDCQVLLRSSGYSPLSAKVKRDAVVIFGIANHLPIMDLNFLLDKNDLAPLF